MEILFLIKYGELALKGKNRPAFEKRLCENIGTQLKGSEYRIIRKFGRLYVETLDKYFDRVSTALKNTFGIVSFSRALQAPKEMGKIEESALILAGELFKGQRGSRFKVAARRADKSFPLNSYEIACRLGDLLLKSIPGLKVDLNNPDWILNIEIRDSVYLYGPEIKSPGGLPLGSSGRSMVLLSGGIDSPVAAYLMGKRGLKIDAVYFHTPPFTSEKALSKVKELAKILSRYLLSISLYTVPFSEAQVRIKERAPAAEMTLLMRAAMMKMAEKLAGRCNCNSLVTGESLGQVASQTAESLRFTGNQPSLPVFRPLIGLDKEEIIEIARRINTFETSIQPFEDCCTLFTPKRPLIRPDLKRMQDSFRSLEIEELLEIAVNSAAVFTF